MEPIQILGTRITLTGFIAFLAWLGVHAFLLTTLPAKVAACFEWVWTYFGGVNVEGILDSPSQPPIGTAFAEDVPRAGSDTQVVATYP